MPLFQKDCSHSVGSSNHSFFPRTVRCQPLSEAEENIVIKVICDTGRSHLPSLSSTHPTRHPLDLLSLMTLMVVCHTLICDLHSQLVTASCCKATQLFVVLLLWAPGSLFVPFVPLQVLVVPLWWSPLLSRGDFYLKSHLLG